MIFPYEIRKVRNVDERLKKYVKDMVLVGPTDFCMPEKYIDEAKKYLEFEVREDDVWILGYLESGTYIAQELARLLCNEVSGENIKKSRNQKLSNTLLEASLLTSEETEPNFISLSEYEGRRFIRTHLPISLLPHDLLDVGCKVIYLARNPKDVAASLYISSSNHPFTYSDIPFETYLKLYTRGLCYFGPQLQHIKEAWEFRDRGNFLFMFYEDLIKDTEAAVRQFADFLSVELADKEVKAVVDCMAIDRFTYSQVLPKNRRKGLWNYINGETLKRVDDWMAINLRNTDLYFPR